MNQLWYLWSSAIVFVVGLLIALYLIVSRKQSLKAVASYLFAVVGLSVFLLYFYSNIGAVGGFFDLLFSTILDMSDVLVGQTSLAATREAFGAVPAEWRGFFALYTAVLHLCATLLLFGFLLSLLRNLFGKTRYHFGDLFGPKASVYVFSALTLRSVLLAEDIYKHHKQEKTPAFLVFLDTEKDVHDALYLQRVQDISGFLFRTPVCELPLYKRQKSKPVSFFLLSDDEGQNLRDALALAEKHRSDATTAQIHIYLRSDKVNTISVVDSIDCTTNLRVHLIHETREKLYHLFDASPLFLGARNQQLTVLVVGAGGNGMEAVKIASWCGQTNLLRPHIVVVDNDPCAEDRFAVSCPELAPSTANILSKQECSIQFHTADVFSATFMKLLAQYPEVGYVICALGDDELNLRAAMSIRKQYTLMRYEGDSVQVAPPLVHVLVDDPYLNQAARELQFDNRVSCELYPYGDLTQMYQYDKIVASYPENTGREVQRFYQSYFDKEKIEKASTKIQAKDSTDERVKKYGKTMPHLTERAAVIALSVQDADKAYESKEYNKTSSIASGMHCKYKLYACLVESGCIAPTSVDWTQHPSEKLLAQYEQAINGCFGASQMEQLAMLEHRRWNVYMRAEGWSTTTMELANRWYAKPHDHRNFSAKLHPMIAPWDTLDEIDAWQKESHGKNGNQKEVDRVLVRNVPAILRNAARRTINGDSKVI